MDLRHYQREAWRFDLRPEDPAGGLAVALLGLGGEVGTLQSTQKKLIRDGAPLVDAHEIATEDVGDVLWYLADSATRLGVDLEDAATANLRKIAQRWLPHSLDFPTAPDAATAALPSRLPVSVTLPPPRLYDAKHDLAHHLPRRFEVLIAPIGEGSEGRVLPVWNGRPCGDRLGDNAYVADGYRFHDAFHLAYAAVLGWSPVFRSLAGLKRKDVDVVDDVEDGGRAIAIEEGLSAFLFEEGRRHGWFETIKTVGSDALALCQRMTANLEIRDAAALEWEAAILAGFDSWRVLNASGSGVVVGDLDHRTCMVRPLSSDEKSVHAAAAREWLAQHSASKVPVREGKLWRSVLRWRGLQ